MHAQQFKRTQDYFAVRLAGRARVEVEGEASACAAAAAAGAAAGDRAEAEAFRVAPVDFVLAVVFDLFRAAAAADFEAPFDCDLAAFFLAGLFATSSFCSVRSVLIRLKMAAATVLLLVSILSRLPHKMN